MRAKRKRARDEERQSDMKRENIVNEREMNLSTRVIEKAGGMRVDEDEDAMRGSRMRETERNRNGVRKRKCSIQ